MAKTAKPKDDAAPRKTGRPSKYTPELAKEIVERLSEGEPLRQICRDEHMPSWRVIYDWMYRDDVAGAAGVGLSSAIARAREIGQDAIAEEIYREVSADPEREERGRIDPGYVQLIKARAEIKLKLLAKWNPKRYGDRVTMAGDAENPLQVQADVSIFDAMLKNLEAKRQLGDK
jgi:hypothetical protein